MAKGRGIIGDTISVVIGWALGLIIAVGLLFVVSAQEDDPWFNCYLSGDMTCGQSEVWHGFTNGFRHMDNR